MRRTGAFERAATSTVLKQLSEVVESRKRTLYSKKVESLEDAFRAIDRNEDGLITRAELCHALERLDIGVGTDLLEVLWKCFDWDGDGCVDLEEFRRACQARTSSTEEVATAEDVTTAELDTAKAHERVGGSPLEDDRVDFSALATNIPATPVISATLLPLDDSFSTTASFGPIPGAGAALSATAKQILQAEAQSLLLHEKDRTIRQLADELCRARAEINDLVDRAEATVTDIVHESAVVLNRETQHVEQLLHENELLSKDLVETRVELARARQDLDKERRRHLKTLRQLERSMENEKVAAGRTGKDQVIGKKSVFERAENVLRREGAKQVRLW